MERISELNTRLRHIGQRSGFNIVRALAPDVESDARAVDDLNRRASFSCSIHRGCRPALAPDAHDPLGNKIGERDTLGAHQGGADDMVLAVGKFQPVPGQGTQTSRDGDISAKQDPEQRSRFAGRSHDEQPNRGQGAEAGGQYVAVGTEMKSEDRGHHDQPEQHADANPHGDPFQLEQR